VDLRAQQTNAATAVTHASGSTSANEALLSLPDAARTGSNPTLVPGVTSPGIALRNGTIVGNPSDGTSGMGSSDTTTNPTYAASDLMGGASVLDTTVTQGTQGNGASVDRAIRQVTKERRRIGRNGQLLNTIAPRPSQ